MYIQVPLETDSEHMYTSLYHSTQAPLECVPQIFNLTGPKIYKGKFDLDPSEFSNVRISETKQDFLDPLVPKFSYCPGLSPTLS